MPATLKPTARYHTAYHVAIVVADHRYDDTQCAMRHALCTTSTDVDTNPINPTPSSEKKNASRAGGKGSVLVHYSATCLRLPWYYPEGRFRIARPPPGQAVQPHRAFVACPTAFWTRATSLAGTTTPKRGCQHVFCQSHAVRALLQSPTTIASKIAQCAVPCMVRIRVFVLPPCSTHSASHAQ